MYYLLFTLYLLLLCFLVNRIRFIKHAGLDKRTVTGLFLLKVGAGIAIGWISQHYYSQGNDYWNLNRDGWEEYQLLIHDPKHFITSLFHSPYADKYGNFFNSVGSYWKDLGYNIIIKILAVLNAATRGNYYINSLFFNFFGFFGHVALYRVFIHIYKRSKWLVVTGCFLLPSTLYFSSGIHRDCIVFALLGLFCYAWYFSIREKKFSPARIVLILLSLAGLLCIRNYVVLALLPATVALYIAGTKKLQPLKVFALVYAAVFIVIMAMTALFPSGQPLKIITQKQKDFFDLPVAASQLPMDTLRPELSSFAENAPQAANHAFLRPYPWEFTGTFLLPLAIEWSIYLLLFLLMLVKYRRHTALYTPFILFGFFLAVSLLLFAGYIVPNAGSLVRYRSLYLPFLITPLLCSIEWRTQTH